MFLHVFPFSVFFLAVDKTSKEYVYAKAKKKTEWMNEWFDEDNTKQQH